jgi:outer membrane protein
MKTFSKLFAVALLAVITLSVNAQSKIGHINSQELLAAMPETDSAQKALEKIAMEHELVLEEMTVEFNKKLDELNTNYENLSDLVRASKEAELQDLQKRVQAFQQTSQQDLQRKQYELMQPIQEKAINAINDVAKENGFTYILDQGTGAIVYSGDDAQNILPLVKAKLGLE